MRLRRARSSESAACGRLKSTCASSPRRIETSTRLLTMACFRSDLLYRINGFQISLAPLRERPEDIEPLARHLLKQVAGTHPPELTEEAFTALRLYGWPGNVRQLKNCLERAVILVEQRPDYALGASAGSYEAGSCCACGCQSVAPSATAGEAPVARGCFLRRPDHSVKLNASRSSPHSSRLAGTEARPPRFSASLPQLSIAACAITISNEDVSHR